MNAASGLGHPRQGVKRVSTCWQNIQRQNHAHWRLRRCRPTLGRRRFSGFAHAKHYQHRPQLGLQSKIESVRLGVRAADRRGLLRAPVTVALQTAITQKKRKKRSPGLPSTTRAVRRRASRAGSPPSYAEVRDFAQWVWTREVVVGEKGTGKARGPSPPTKGTAPELDTWRGVARSEPLNPLGPSGKKVLCAVS